MKTLNGRVAVVTGAAGGLGRAIAHELARRGCHLALVDTRATALNRVADEVAVPVSIHVADVTDRERLAAVRDKAMAEHGCIHILVNNAGVTTVAPFREHDADDFSRIMDTNFGGVVNGCRVFLPVLSRVDRAAIVNVSSMVAWGSAPLQAAYCASKAAIRSVSEVLAAELAGTSVSITCAFPGPLRTELLHDSAFVRDEDRDRIMPLVSARALEPQRVAAAIVSAMLKRKLYVWVGWDARLWAWVARCCPALLVRMLGHQYRRHASEAAEENPRA